MIEILTLFLGLVTGPQTAELAVGDRAAEVEVLLDGQPVATLDGPPWRLQVDLGEALLPHELLAVARDESGAELARARRWINIDMVRVEIGGRAPPGGLTPLPIVLADGRRVTTEEVSDWFTADGEALRVRATQAGLAEVIVVQDPATQRDLEEMARLLPARELDDGLGDDTAVRFISPLAAPVSRSDRQRSLFMQSAGVSDVGLFWLAGKLPPMTFAYRYADAVAVAGREAHAAGRRRAVLLLLRDRPRDDSLFSVAAVRDYLRALRVPLFVWTLTDTGELAGWGEPDWVGLRSSGQSGPVRAGAISKGFLRFREAVAELRREIDRQRIVWLVGERPPHRIELSPEAVGARSAGLDPADRPTGRPGGRSTTDGGAS